MEQTQRRKYIGYLTQGVREIAEETPGFMAELLMQFETEAERVDDWFYSLDVAGVEVFAADNGEDGYTACLPDEY